MKHDFIQLMRNRLVMGAFRYGRTRDYNYHKYMLMKIDEYSQTGNLEMLVDTANMALLAWQNPSCRSRPVYVHDVLRARLVGWMDTCTGLPALDKLYQTEWCPEFEAMMKSAYIICRELSISYYDDYDFVTVAALAWLEFESPGHPNAHWHAVDNRTIRCP